MRFGTKPLNDLLRLSIVAAGLVLCDTGRSETSDEVHRLRDAVYEFPSNPSGPWAFWTAGNPPDWGKNIEIDPATYQIISFSDHNRTEDRFIWHSVERDPWSRPAVRIEHYSDPEKRRLLLLTKATEDILVSWTCPRKGSWTLKGAVQDLDPNEARDGILRISRNHGAAPDEEVLELVPIPDNAETPARFELSVELQEGDLIFFRKTFFKPDDFGCTRSGFEVEITPAP